MSAPPGACTAIGRRWNCGARAVAWQGFGSKFQRNAKTGTRSCRQPAVAFLRSKCCRNGQHEQIRSPNIRGMPVQARRESWRPAGCPVFVREQENGRGGKKGCKRDGLSFTFGLRCITFQDRLASPGRRNLAWAALYCSSVGGLGGAEFALRHSGVCQSAALSCLRNKK